MKFLHAPNKFVISPTNNNQETTSSLAMPKNGKNMVSVLA